MSSHNHGASLQSIFLSEEDLIAAGAKDMAACIETMESMMAALASSDYRMAGKNANSHGSMISFPKSSVHPKMPLDAPDRRFMAMPAYLGGAFHRSGVKWYGSNVENRASGLPRSIHTLVLNDADSSVPLAIMSGNLISSFRTGAISGLAAKYLSCREPKTVTIVGPGTMGRTALRAFMAAQPTLNKLIVKGRGRQSIDSFCGWAQSEFSQLESISVANSLPEAFKGADIVSICSTSLSGIENYPLLNEDWFEPGTLLTAPGVANFEDSFLQRNDVRLILDYRGLYDAWQEEYYPDAFNEVGIIGNKFLQLVESGRIAPESVVDIPQILESPHLGRRSEDEIILFSVGGMPVEDVAWASYLYDRCVEKGLGTAITYWSTPSTP